MKYSQGRQKALGLRLISSAKPYVKAISPQHWNMPKPRKIAEKAYGMLSQEFLSFLKIKHGQKAQKAQKANEQLSDPSSSSIISYLPRSDINLISTSSETANVSEVTQRVVSSSRQSNSADACNPFDVIKSSVGLSKAINPNGNVQIKGEVDNPIEVAISALRLEQVLLFLFNCGFARQQVQTKKLVVSINVNQKHCFIAISDAGKSIPNSVTTQIEIAKKHLTKVVDIQNNEEHIVDTYLRALQTLLKVGGMLELKSANNFYNLSLLTIPLTIVRQEPKNQRSDSKLLQFQHANNLNHEEVSLSKSHQVSRVIEPDSLFVKTFKKLLHNNYQAPDFKRPNAASMLSMSEKTLARRLTYHYGSSFNSIVKNYRLEKAYQMIAKGVPVSNSAYSVGFNSASYFTLCFKRKFGFAPSILANKLN